MLVSQLNDQSGRNTPRDSDSQCITIGIVNNMPDSALQATEHQFLSLIDEAAKQLAVHVSFYVLDSVPRSEAGLRHVASYSQLEKLWSFPLDGLIVTGTEPRAVDLTDEPYWESLTRLINWAESNTSSTIWSCLAAHAAVLYLDGIRRERQKEKRFGVFDCIRVIDHELTAGLSSRVCIPHSRWNDLGEEQLRSSGYSVLTRSEAGVDVFVKQLNSLFVFVQGHPEYETETLLHEYRRDVRRFLTCQSETYPVTPTGYFDDDTVATLAILREHAFSNRSDKMMMDPATVPAKVTNTWRSAAVALYTNWLSYLSQRKRREKTTLVAGLHG
jgi:homoserine O-succinyltransferase